MQTEDYISTSDTVTMHDSEEKDDRLSSDRLEKSLFISPNPDVNSYKFAKPMVYVKKQQQIS